MLNRVVIVATLALAVATTAGAQSTPAMADQAAKPATASKTKATPSSSSSSTTEEVQTRPATTTFMGDTGLWYVPTAEVLPHKMWSVSAYRVNFDDNQGFTDVSNWPATFAYGLSDHAELFGSWVLVNRIDRDIRPLYVSTIPKAGGIVPENPLNNQTWSGNNLGDLWIGVKWNLMSQWQQKKYAVALRPMLKLPVGDTDSGASSGKVDFALDAVISKEVNQRVEYSGYVGFITRGAPAEVESTGGFRWGFGVGAPSRKSLRLTAELTGESYFSGSLATKELMLAPDGSFLPIGFVSDVNSPVDLNLGLTWQGKKGVFAGLGWTYRFTVDSRDTYLSSMTNGAGDRMDIVGRIGYHPGVRVFVPPPAPKPMPEPPKAGPAAHDLSVKANCNPCTVEVGKISTVSAIATDSIGCSVTYSWSAPAGTFTNATAQNTPWTAPQQEGPVQVTVRVTCPTDGKTASDTVTIQVVRPNVAAPIVFEDVHFDFDRYSLRPEAVRALDEAVAVLQKNPDVKVTIEGHTCNIGTAEYNLALGERRANSVRDYLVSRGISADRFTTVSYGEERPKYDNAREETRRLNRRAALVVRLTR